MTNLLYSEHSNMVFLTDVERSYWIWYGQRQVNWRHVGGFRCVKNHGNKIVSWFIFSRKENTISFMDFLVLLHWRIPNIGKHQSLIRYEMARALHAWFFKYGRKKYEGNLLAILYTNLIYHNLWDHISICQHESSWICIHLKHHN